MEQVSENSEMCLNLIRDETVWQKNLLHIIMGEFWLRKSNRQGHKADVGAERSIR